MSNKISNNQKLNRQRQNFLLTFFDKNEYTEKEINGFWLVKQWNGNTERWQVAIYPKGHLEKKAKQEVLSIL